MMKLLCGALLAALTAFGQTKPEFEVASVKPSGGAAEGHYNVGLHIDGAQVRCTYLSLKDYVLMAYRLKNYQFSGPEWMSSERFDVSAKLPSGATRPDVLPMLQKLLEDRFELKTHRDSKEFPVYALTVAKGGLKLKQSAAEPDAPAPAVNVTVNAGAGGVNLDLGNGSHLSFGNNRIEAAKVTMVMLAEQLSRFVDRPIVDSTNVQGNYDFALDFQPEDFRAMMIRSAISAGVSLPPEALRLLENSSDGGLITAIQSLGLKLESRKAPIEVIVVDHALKVPAEN